MARTRRDWGYIEKSRSKEGGWLASYLSPEDDTERIRAPYKFTRKLDADAWLAKERQRILTGTWKHPSVEKAEAEAAREQAERDRYTLGDFWPVFIKEMCDWAPSHLNSETRRYHARIEPRWADVPLKEIKHQDVAHWLEEMQTAPRQKKGQRKREPEAATPATKVKCLALLSRILTEAADRQLIDHNPLLGRKYLTRKARAGNRPERNIAIARDIEDVRTLLAEVPEYSRPVWWLMAFCGLRSEEARPIQLKDFDFENDLVKITHTVTGSGSTTAHRDDTKTRAGRREVPLDPRVSAMFQEHCQKFKITRKNQFLAEAPTKPGECMVPQVLREQSQRICKRHNIEPYITLHQLRHTAITTAHRLGSVTKIDVKEWVGHAHDEDITDHYTHSDLEHARQIAVHVADAILDTEAINNVVQFPGHAAIA